ncbi:hypothetical protein [Raoultella ornithinolytica]
MTTDITELAKSLKAAAEGWRRACSTIRRSAEPFQNCEPASVGFI